VKVGGSTDEVDREILNLRRARRAGGQLREGDVLGHYTLLRRLGKGGFAVVWEAHDTIKNQRVALKVLHPELAGEASRLERFRRGAREMAALHHEAVVRVLEQRGEDDGWHYFVMEFFPRGDLRRAVVEKGVSHADVLRIINRVGGALIAAHAKGLIHRDVKPANILLDGSGAPRLTDFDLVAASGTTGGTRTGAMGTFLYAAPEQMDRPQDVDARADVYGLGMTAVFMLYGKELPIKGIMTERDRIVDGLSCAAAVKATLKKAIAWKETRDLGAWQSSVRPWGERSASSIGNAHIVDISDFGDLPDGSIYYVMEFLNGRSLIAIALLAILALAITFSSRVYRTVEASVRSRGQVRDADVAPAQSSSR
jgi:eukaryotic-like serine/threonine-protein kinase